jgi:hypothetical protein
VPSIGGLDFKVGPSIIGYKRLFSTSIQDGGGFARLKTSVFDRNWKHTVSPPKRDQP